MQLLNAIYLLIVSLIAQSLSVKHLNFLKANKPREHILKNALNFQQLMELAPEGIIY